MPNEFEDQNFQKSDYSRNPIERKDHSMLLAFLEKSN
jgi:hypothetical protein